VPEEYVKTVVRRFIKEEKEGDDETEGKALRQAESFIDED